MNFSELLKQHPIIFIGAGMSVRMGYPDAKDLALDLSPYLSGKNKQLESLDETIEKIKEEKNREKTIEILQNWVKPQGTANDPENRYFDPYFLLKKCMDKVGGEFILVTTNWDLEIDRISDMVIKVPDDYTKIKSKKIITIKLAGDFNGPIFLSSQEKKEHGKERERLYLHVFGNSVAKPVIMLGYSAKDGDFKEWAQRAHAKVELSVALRAEDVQFCEKQNIQEEDIVQFLRDEVKNLGIDLPQTITPLAIYNKITDVANIAADKGKSFIGFAPRLSGKTFAFDYITKTENKNGNHALISEFKKYDIAASSDNTENLLGVLDNMTQSKVFLTATPCAIEWACRSKGLKSIDCETIPIIVSRDEAEKYLWEWCNQQPNKLMQKVLEVKGGSQLVDTILNHSKIAFCLFKNKGTTFRLSLIGARLHQLSEERSNWSGTNEEFVTRAKEELKKTTARISEYGLMNVGTGALLSAETLVVLAGPVTRIVSMFVPQIALAAVTVPLISGIVSRLTGKENKIGGLAELAKFWNDDLLPCERETLAENFDGKLKCRPGTSYTNLARIFGDKDFTAQITETVNEYVDKNKLNLTQQLVGLLEENTEFRQLVKRIFRDEFDSLRKDLQDQIDELRSMQLEQDRRLTIVETALDGRTICGELQKYDFSFILEPLRNGFVGRGWLFNNIGIFMMKNSCGYVKIVADAGLGKTAIASECVWKFNASAYFFFNKSMGITEAEKALNYISAQIIKKYGLPYEQLPQASGMNSNFLYKILDEAAKKTNYESNIIVVIDALDEAESVSDGNNWLHLPPRLPHKVYFIVTNRPGAYRIATAPDTSFKELRIEYNDDYHLRDVEEYLLVRSRDPNIRKVLELSQPSVAPQQFVAALIERSEGNFMYLSYVLSDIESEHRVDLNALPSGLKAYYEGFWDQMKSKVDIDSWWNFYEPVLGLLGIAPEPVSAEWLAALTGRQEREVNEKILSQWSRFLRCQSTEHADRWVVIHQSFADFLHERKEKDMEPIVMHKYVVKYYLDDKNRWQLHDAYALRNLGYHLQKANLMKDFAQLLENPAWFQTQRNYDISLDIFLTDVNNLCEFSEKKGLLGLPDIISWSLWSNTLRQRPSSLPDSILRTLVLAGHADTAERLINILAKDSEKVHSYIEISALFYRSSRSDLCIKMLEKALKLTQSMVNQSIRCEVLEELIEKMAQVGETAKALKLAEDIGYESKQFETVSTVAEAMAKRGDTSGAMVVLEKSMKMAKYIKDDYERENSLTNIAKAMAWIGESQLALNIADDIEDRDQRIEIMNCIAEDMAEQGNADGALKIIESIGAEHINEAALIAIAKAVAHDNEASRTINIVKSIGSKFIVVNPLNLAAQVTIRNGNICGAREILEESMNIVEGIEQKNLHAEMLSDIAELMILTGDAQRAHKLFLDSIKIIESIDEQDGRVSTIVYVAKAMLRIGDKRGAIKLLNDSLKRLESIKGETLEMCGDIAEGMALAGEFEKALTIVDKQMKERDYFATKDAYNEISLTFARALANAKDALVGMEELAELLKLVEDIEINQLRADVLIAITKSLAQKGETTQSLYLLRDWLKLADGIEYKSGRSDELNALSETMAKIRDIPGVITLIKNMQDQAKRDDITGAFSEALARNGNSAEALKIVEGIGDKYKRSWASIAVCKVMALDGPNARVLQAIEESLKLSESFEDKDLSAAMQNEVAMVLLQMGDAEGAMTLLERSLKLLKCNEPVLYDSGTLRAIAQTIAKAGDTSKALELAEYLRAKYVDNNLIGAPNDVVVAMALLGDTVSAIKLEKSIVRGIKRSEALNEIAIVVARSGNNIVTQKLLEESQRISESIDHVDVRIQALIAVAEARKQIGDSSESMKLLEKSAELAKTIAYSWGLDSVARAMAKAGNSAEAFEVISNITNTHTRDKTLYSVIEIVATSGDITTCMKMAEKIKEKDIRIRALCSIAVRMGKVNDFDGVQKILKRSLKLADSITDFDIDSSLALISIAEAMVRTGNTNMALSMLGDVPEVYLGPRSTTPTLRIKRVFEAIAEVLDSTPIDDMEEIITEFKIVLKFARMGRLEIFDNFEKFTGTLVKIGIMSETWRRYKAIYNLISS